MSRLALILLLVCLGAVSASALQVKFMAPRDLVAASSVIVRARVTTSHSMWRARDIVTDATVVVLDTVVGRVTAPATGGSGQPILTVRQLGGTIGDTEMHVAGVRYLRPGEEALLFLRTDGERHYLVGFSQGSLFLETVGGTEWVRRETAGLEFVVTRRNGPGPNASAPLPEREPFAPLRARIVALARELGR